ncbi:MAG: LysR family transcriptional regulator, partial [Deltaproteobacteria bacterium]|nr:LysR family transcriptional regulator [Deltaproteobacteria bacterium]
MTLDQLRVLNAILETGSFRAAAETLNRAQSAVSYAIRNLEDELRISLFDRSGYRPRLTAAGQAIYEKSKTVLLQAEELLKLGDHLSMGQEAEIKLAINATCPFSKVIDVINSFSRDQSSVKIVLTIENLGGSIEQLLDGNVDMALAEAVDWDERLEASHWNKIKFLPVSAPVFPPASLKRALVKSDLIAFPQIIVSDSSRHTERRTVGVLKEGLHWTVNDFSVKRQLLLAGSGWGLMPEHFIQEDLDHH